MVRFSYIQNFEIKMFYLQLIAALMVLTSASEPKKEQIPKEYQDFKGNWTKYFNATQIDESVKKYLEKYVK